MKSRDGATIWVLPGQFRFRLPPPPLRLHRERSGVTLVRSHTKFGVIPKMSAYNEAVRHYTIKMMSGFAKFNCLVCKHSVTTREFSSQNGSCRTQAARAMNDHALAAHCPPSPISPSLSQKWSVCVEGASRQKQWN